MSLVEIILFLMMNVYFDRFVLFYFCGVYFGVVLFYDLGFVLVLFGGGLILDYYDGLILFFVVGGFCFVVIYLYVIFEKLFRLDFVNLLLK